MSGDREALMALENCPFCGEPMLVLGGVNPYGRCETEGCWMHDRKMTVPIDDPRQVATWNQRVRPAAADQGVRDLRKAVGQAISDPGATEGYKGERTLTDWQADAVLRILALLPKPVEGAGEIDDAPVRIAIWNVLRNDGVSDERCYRLIEAVCGALRTPATTAQREGGL